MAENTFFANRATAYVVTANTPLTGYADFTQDSEIVQWVYPAVGLQQFNLNSFNRATLASDEDSLPDLEAGDYIANYRDLDAFDGSRVESIDANGTITLSYTYPDATQSNANVVKLTLTPISAMKGFELIVKYEVAELYSQDTTYRVDSARHDSSVEFKVKYAKFDGTPSSAWDTEIIDPEHINGGGKVTDTVDVYTPLILIRFPDKDCHYQEILLKDVFFEGLPFPMPENEFLVRDITGKGETLRLKSW